MAAEKLLGGFVIRGHGPCHSRLDLISQVIDYLYHYQNKEVRDNVPPWKGQLHIDVSFQVAPMPSAYDDTDATARGQFTVAAQQANVSMPSMTTMSPPDPAPVTEATSEEKAP